METAFYQQYATVEDTHWWFVGRRRIVRSVIASLKLPATADILEVGCGTGGNLRMLSHFGQLNAMELNGDARALANTRDVVAVEEGRLPDRIPFATQYDLIVALDVIEHVADDRAAVAALCEYLKPGGYLLITVPAFPFLWSLHDEINHHFRRYRLGGLKTLIQQAGLQLQVSSYFNTWLFPAVALIRVVRRALKLEDKNKGQSDENHSDDLKVPMPLINHALIQLFGSERFLVQKPGLPFGVSAIVLARK
jgi:SAM-dependent methyltransferase